MAGDLENDELIKMGVAANLAKSYVADQRAFVTYLAAMLESVLPDQTEIERRGGLFAEKKIHKLKVKFSDYAYTLEAPAKGALIASRTKIVRGIALKTETLSIEEWLQALSEEISEYAHSNQRSADALKSWLEG